VRNNACRAEFSADRAPPRRGAQALLPLLRQELRHVAAPAWLALGAAAALATSSAAYQVRRGRRTSRRIANY
jgi:uracil-DNA glycosylase